MMKNKIFIITILTINLSCSAAYNYNPAASASPTSANSTDPFAGINKPAVTLNLFGGSTGESTWDTLAEAIAWPPIIFISESQ